MAVDPINNGAFADDPSAESIREGFTKVNNQFAELFNKIPLELTGEQGKILVVKATEDGFELLNATGVGDLLAANNLSDILNPATARTNLGLGSAAESASSDFATSAQGTKADNAIQTISNGGGVTVDASDPQNLVLSVDAVTVTGLSFNPGTGVLTLAVSGSSDIAVDLSNYTVLKIGGLYVDKDAANSNNSAIENNDYAFGWVGDEFVAYKQVSGSPAYAIRGGI